MSKIPPFFKCFGADFIISLIKSSPSSPELTRASFGSCFANPSGDHAGRLIEAAGLKGFRIGGCGFSEIHANFLINYGGGSFEDALNLINLAKERVYELFGIRLRCEVVIL